MKTQTQTHSLTHSRRFTKTPTHEDSDSLTKTHEDSLNSTTFFFFVRVEKLPRNSRFISTTNDMVGAFRFAAVAAALAASAVVSANPSSFLLLRHGERAQPLPNGAAGAVVAISQSGLDFVCQQVLEPMLEKELDDLKFDDIDTEKDGIKIHIDNLKTHDFKCDNCLKAALVSGSGLQVDLKNFEIKLHWR